jgi:hypothetical protein
MIYPIIQLIICVVVRLYLHLEIFYFGSPLELYSYYEVLLNLNILDLFKDPSKFGCPGPNYCWPIAWTMS